LDTERISERVSRRSQSGLREAPGDEARRRWRLARTMTLAVRGFMGSLNPAVDMRNNRAGAGRPPGDEGMPRAFGDRTALLRRHLGKAEQDPV